MDFFSLAVIVPPMLVFDIRVLATLFRNDFSIQQFDYPIVLTFTEVSLSDGSLIVGAYSDFLYPPLDLSLPE